MANKNAVLEAEMLETDESFDLDALEEALESQLEDELSDLEMLEEEQEQIGSPDHLGEVIQGVVWEQFINQIAVTAGEDFIKENHGLTLDLRDSAHIQTAENFAEGKIATHNYISKEQLEKNYDRYKNTPHGKFRIEHVNPGMNATLKRAGQLNKQGVDTVTDIYTGKQIPTQTKTENGKNNPKAAQREHVKSSAELYKSPSLQMANTDKELAAIVNDPQNLQGYTTAERNNRKNDNSSDEMSEQDKTKHWKKADEKAEEFIKEKEQEGEERLKKEGRKTQKEEAFRISKKALRAVLMQLLANLVRKIIGKMVRWFKSTKRELGTLLDGLKEAIQEFVGEMKTHLISAGNTVFTTVFTAIYGQIFATIKKVWMMLKQGWKALKEAVQYLRDPKNKGQSLGRRLLETGKIVIAGMTGVSALLLGEAVEKGLMAVPIFAVEIPLIGSLANILGIFIGAVVAGIIGAIAINLIQKQIEKNQKSENMTDQVNKGNQVLATQDQLRATKEAQMNQTKAKMVSSVVDGHSALNEMETEFETVVDQNLKAVGALQNNNNDTSEQNAANDAALNELLGAY